MLKHAAIAALTCTLAPCALAGDLTIADLAPSESMFVMGIDDISQAKASFERTGMMKIWDDPSVQNWFKEMSSEFMEEMTGTLEEVGFDKDDLKAPTGAMGVAAWFDIDTEPGADPEPSVLVFADYENQAEAMHELVVQLMEKGEEEGEFDIKQEDYRGADVFQMTNYNHEMPGPICYAAHKGNLVVTSEPDLMEHAIDIIEGDEADTIAENAEYRSAYSMIESPGIHFVMLTEQFLDSVLEQVAREGMVPPDMFNALTDALGIGEITSIAAGAMLDTADGVMEMKYAARLNEKKGLVALLDQPAGNFEVPAFVDADTATFSTLKFDFAGIPAIVNQIMGQLPPEQAGMGGMFLGMAQPILENLGPDVHIMQSYTRPFSPTSQQDVVVIEVKDADALAQSITSTGAMMGLQARDFMGNQIWSMGGGMGGDSAFGLGFGHLFVGPTAPVENAMRLASNPGDNSLANSKAFKRAAATTGRGIGFSYSDIRQTMEWADWYISNMEDIKREQLEQAFAGIPEEEIDAEWRDQLMQEQLGSIPAWLRNAPEIGQLVMEIMGDTVTEYSSTPEGFVGSMVTLRPADN